MELLGKGVFKLPGGSTRADVTNAIQTYSNSTKLNLNPVSDQEAKAKFSASLRKKDIVEVYKRLRDK